MDQRGSLDAPDALPSTVSKNYMFVGHARAGRNIAGLYPLVGSCIANGWSPPST
jgi:hypothetical protein